MLHVTGIRTLWITSMMIYHLLPDLIGQITWVIMAVEKQDISLKHTLAFRDLSVTINY